MFKLLGLMVLAYTAYAALKGEVFAKRGPFASVVERTVSPNYFWIVISIYAVLGLALLTVF